MLVLHRKKIQYLEFQGKNRFRKLKGGRKFYKSLSVRKLFFLNV